MKNTLRQKGFTLIELLVVIVILGILSTISVGTFRNYFAKARDSERVSAVQNLAMMVKVGTGGDGNCGVYNLGFGADCDDTYDIDTLIVDNDYKMPESKSGLKYYYGFLEGSREGDNDFFMVAGAEEGKPQNGQELDDDTSPISYVFVDGTRAGIDIVVAEGSVDDDGIFTLTNAGEWDFGEITIDDDGTVAIDGATAVVE